MHVTVFGQLTAINSLTSHLHGSGASRLDFDDDDDNLCELKQCIHCGSYPQFVFKPEPCSSIAVFNNGNAKYVSTGFRAPARLRICP